VGEGLTQQAEVERAGLEESGEEAELAEGGDEGAVHPTGLALLGEGPQALGREDTELRTPGGLLRIE
jgi:hypothetical protein